MTDEHPVADIKHRIEHHRYERGKEHRAEQPPDSLVSEIESVSVHNNNILIWQDYICRAKLQNFRHIAKSGNTSAAFMAICQNPPDVADLKINYYFCALKTNESHE